MKQSSMLSGTISKSLIAFAIPMLLSSMFQQLFSTVDLYFVGNYIGKQGAAAIGATSILITCSIGMFTGISTGIGIVVAQMFGAKESVEIKKITSLGVVMGVSMGICLTVIGNVFIEDILRLLQTPMDIRSHASRYAKVYILGIVPMLLFQMYTAIWKAQGEARKPLYVLILGGICNVLLDYWFIVVLNWGVVGAAGATVISQWMVLGITVCWYHIVKKEGLLTLRQITHKRQYVRRMLSLGIPAGIQAVLLTCSNVVMQYYVNQIGSDQVAAFAAYFKIETAIYLPILAMGQTVMIFVSQNRGAGQKKRAIAGIKQGIIVSLCVTMLLSGMMLVVGGEVFQFLIQDQGVTLIGTQIIAITFPLYFIYAILECVACAIRGMGNSMIPMIHSLIALCGIRVVLMIGIVGRTREITWIASVYPITWAICAMLNVVYLIIRIKKEKIYDRSDDK